MRAKGEGEALAAHAQYWVSFADDTRYMALGDSLSAGYGARRATQGFVYGLYQSGGIDNLNNTLSCDAGGPGVKSADVLAYQVPQVGLFFSDTGTPRSLRCPGPLFGAALGISGSPPPGR